MIALAVPAAPLRLVADMRETLAVAAALHDGGALSRAEGARLFGQLSDDLDDVDAALGFAADALPELVAAGGARLRPDTLPAFGELMRSGLVVIDGGRA